MPRTLLIKLGAIGDAVMLLPAAYELYRSGQTVDWVCGAELLPLLRLYPWVNPIVADEAALLAGSAGRRMRAMAGLWRRLAGRRYDLVATLYYDKRYRMLTLPVRARRKLLLSHTDRNRRLLPGRHHTDEYARLLLGWKDEHRATQLSPVPPPALPASPLAMGLASPPARSARTRIVLAPAGAKNLLADDALRRWPAESYVALASMLARAGHEVVLLGSAGDAWVQPLFAGVPVMDRIGLDSLPETLALLDEADLLVTHDTGPLHLAGLVRCAVVGIFGPTDPRGRLPQRTGTLALWGGEGFSCRPCYDGRTFAPCPQNDCMRQYTPAMVYDEVLEMLEARAEGEVLEPRVATPAHTPTHTQIQIRTDS